MIRKNSLVLLLVCMVFTGCVTYQPYIEREFFTGPESKLVVLKGDQQIRLVEIKGENFRFAPWVYRFDAAAKGFKLTLKPGEYTIKYYAATADLASATDLVERTVDLEAGKVYYVHSVDLEDSVNSWISEMVPGSNELKAEKLAKKCRSFKYPNNISFCTESFNLGNAEAANLLAKEYDDSNTAHYSKRKYAEWHKKASDLGYEESTLHYASVLWRGEGVEKDAVAAKKMFEQLLETTEEGWLKSGCHMQLGLMAELGATGRPNIHKAIEHYRHIGKYDVTVSGYLRLVDLELGLKGDKENLIPFYYLAMISGDLDVAETLNQKIPSYWLSHSEVLKLIETHVEPFKNDVGLVCGLDELVKRDVQLVVNDRLTFSTEQLSYGKFYGFGGGSHDFTLLSKGGEEVSMSTKFTKEDGKIIPACFLYHEEKSEWRLNKGEFCQC